MHPRRWVLHSYWSSHFNLQISLFADWFTAAVTMSVFYANVQSCVWHPTKFWLLEYSHHVVCWDWLCYLLLWRDGAQIPSLTLFLSFWMIPQSRPQRKRTTLFLLMHCVCVIFLLISPYTMAAAWWHVTQQGCTCLINTCCGTKKKTHHHRMQASIF